MIYPLKTFAIAGKEGFRDPLGQQNFQRRLKEEHNNWLAP